MSSLDFYKPLHSLLTDIVTFYTKFFTCEGEHFWPSVVTEEIEATKFSYLALCVSLHIDLFFFFLLAHRERRAIQLQCILQIKACM